MNESRLMQEKDTDKKASDISINVINMETLIASLENELEQPVHNSFFPELDEMPILSDKAYNRIQQETTRAIYGNWDKQILKLQHN